MQNDKQLIPHLFRTEYSKITAVLCKLFGIAHIELAEDIASDTFMQATETWGLKGLPENPTAWLYTVSKNKAKDYLKRNTLFTQKITRAIQNDQNEWYELEVDLSSKNINDSQLQMMFAICHPCISAEAQIGLSLRILCGFGIEEIADAFLTNKETINKRLFRAKEKLRTEEVKIEFPKIKEISKRLDAVLITLYLLFNEGYYSLSKNTILRKDLCLEAMRLNYLLVANPNTNLPPVNALLALMCFHASRFEARTDQHGEPVLYDDQDVNLWNQELIAKGEFYLNEAASGNSLSKYHLEAAIAYWHTKKNNTPEKWESILQLYNKLLIIEYSPMAALNRTYALARARDKADAIIEAEKLNLSGNHLYFSLLGYLYTGANNIKALENYRIALKIAKSDADKASIKKQLERILANK